MGNLIDKPYSLRQFLVVEKDEIIETKLLAEEKIFESEIKSKEKDNDKNEDSNDNLWRSIIAGVISIRGFGVVPLAAGIGIAVIDVVLNSIKKQRELAKRVNVNYISFTDSLDLKFPIGHPRENELYVAHPTLIGTYYPINEFHKKAFEHKFSELILLLTNLGAKKINVEYISGWDFNSINELDAEKKAKTKINVKLLKDKKLIYNAEYINNESLKLPDNLAWYHHEPTWQSVGEGRLNHDLRNFHLLLEYNDDFGINADLFAEISKLGLGLD